MGLRNPTGKNLETHSNTKKLLPAWLQTPSFRKWSLSAPKIAYMLTKSLKGSHIDYMSSNLYDIYDGT